MVVGSTDVTRLYVNLRQVCKDREQPLAVVDHDRVSGEVHRRSHDDLAAVRRANGRPGLANEIHARMRRAPLAVVVAARSEVARRLSVHRQHEGVRPFPGRYARVRVGEHRAVSFDLFESLRRRLDEAARDAEASHRKLLRKNAQRRRYRLGRAVAVDAQTIRVGLRIEIDADERLMFPLPRIEVKARGPAREPLP